MIRIRQLQKELHNLVGWSSESLDGHRLYSRQRYSASGLYFQDAHPMLTLDNIYSVIKERRISEYSTYSNDETYKRGDVVLYEENLYICTAEQSHGVPPDGSDFNDDFNDDFGNANWRRYDQLCEYLDGRVDAGIAAMANNFVMDKVLAGKSKQLIEHKCFYDGAGRSNNRITGSDRLVGFEIEPQRGIGITTLIHRIGLQMVGGNGVVKMYVFHSSQPEPVYTFNVRMLRNDGFQWFNIDDRDVYLPYLSEKTNAGGSWYLCYHQSELPYGMEAVNISRDWSKDPCGQCSRVNLEAWRNLTKYVRLSPFASATASTFPQNPVFDPSAVTYTPSLCYGLNAEISIGCDLTDFIIRQKHIFASTLQKQVCYDVLRAIVYNPNANTSRNQLNASRSELIGELDGNQYTRSGGIRSDLKKCYEALDIDTTGLDTACLACKRIGIRMGGI